MWRRYLSAAAILLVLFGIVLVTNQYVLEEGNADLAEQKTPTTSQNDSNEADPAQDCVSEEKLVEVPADIEPSMEDEEVVQPDPSGAPAPEQELITTALDDNAEKPQPTPQNKETPQRNNDVTADQKMVHEEPTEMEEELVVAGAISAESKLSKEQVSVDEMDTEVSTEPHREQNNYSSASHSDIQQQKVSPTLAGNNSTTVAQYLNNFTLSDSAAALNIQGEVSAELSFDRKGNVQKVSIKKGLHKTIDNEVIQYLQGFPKELVPLNEQQKRVRQTDVIVTVP